MLERAKQDHRELDDGPPSSEPDTD